MTTDEQAEIVAKYEELAAEHLRTIQDLARVTAQLAFCRGQRDRAVTALLGDDPWPLNPWVAALRDELRLHEHEQS